VVDRRGVPTNFLAASRPSLAREALAGLRPPAALASRQQCHPWPLLPWRASARRPRWLHGSNAIPGHCCLGGPPPAGRAGFTAAMPSLAIAALAGLRPPAAPPGGRVRARCGARRSSRRIFVAAGLCPAVPGAGWRADSADRTSAATPVGLRGVARAPEPALMAERSRPIRFAYRCPLRSEASIERPEGRRAPIRRRRIGRGVNARRDGTGHPEPGCDYGHPREIAWAVLSRRAAGGKRGEVRCAGDLIGPWRCGGTWAGSGLPPCRYPSQAVS
jgi:hypothetical protein